MPNGEQAQEGVESMDESADWQSPDDDDEEESDELDDEEEVDSPPRIDHRSKQSHDPAVGATRQLLQAHKCINALKLRLRSHLKSLPSSPRWSL